MKHKHREHCWRCQEEREVYIQNPDGVTRIETRKYLVSKIPVYINFVNKTKKRVWRRVGYICPVCKEIEYHPIKSFSWGEKTHYDYQYLTDSRKTIWKVN
jgi:hypothetical protein